jgi:hypothetical protein
MIILEIRFSMMSVALLIFSDSNSSFFIESGLLNRVTSHKIYC